MPTCGRVTSFPTGPLHLLGWQRFVFLLVVVPSDYCFGFHCAWCILTCLSLSDKLLFAAAAASGEGSVAGDTAAVAETQEHTADPAVAPEATPAVEEGAQQLQQQPPVKGQEIVGTTEVNITRLRPLA